MPTQVEALPQFNSTQHLLSERNTCPGRRRQRALPRLWGPQPAPKLLLREGGGKEGAPLPTASPAHVGIHGHACALLLRAWPEGGALPGLCRRPPPAFDSHPSPTLPRRLWAPGEPSCGAFADRGRLMGQGPYRQARPAADDGVRSPRQRGGGAGREGAATSARRAPSPSRGPPGSSRPPTRRNGPPVPIPASSRHHRAGPGSGSRCTPWARP